MKGLGERTLPTGLSGVSDRSDRWGPRAEQRRASCRHEQVRAQSVNTGVDAGDLAVTEECKGHGERQPRDEPDERRSGVQTPPVNPHHERRHQLDEDIELAIHETHERLSLAQREGNLRRRIAFFNARGGTMDIRRANRLKRQLATTERRQGDLEAAQSGQLLVVQPSSALSGIGQPEAPATVALPFVGKVSKGVAVTVGVLGLLAYLGYRGQG